MTKGCFNILSFLRNVQISISILRIIGSNALASQPATPAATPAHLRNSRFVCLLDDYLVVRGPYFSALFDQLLQEQCDIPQRRIALCTSASYAAKTRELLPQLQEDLLVLDEEEECCRLFVLDDYNPMSLQEEIEQFNPSIFWVVDDNAFRIRYQLRTSGMDGILNNKCGGPVLSRNCLYVGENAGAVIAGASLGTAHAMNYDPKQASEPQYFGVNLLGPNRSISYGLSKDELIAHPKTTDIAPSSLLALKREQIFVWSQPPKEDTTSFIFLPSQRGTIEQWESPPPIPPLVDFNSDSNIGGGVQCDGEPSIDPSRVMQQVGDSEWINEVGDAS